MLPIIGLFMIRHERNLDTEWSDEARLTFNRLPIDVQAGLIKQLPQLVVKYADLYRRRPLDSKSVGTVSHIQVPGWSMWLRLETEYHEDEIGPVLFIYGFEELSSKEFEQSLTIAKAMPGRVNPSNS